jgi:hypothetical protein
VARLKSRLFDMGARCRISMADRVRDATMHRSSQDVAATPTLDLLLLHGLSRTVSRQKQAPGPADAIAWRLWMFGGVAMELTLAQRRAVELATWGTISVF